MINRKFWKRNSNKLIISYGKTFNLGNFESERIDFSREVDINDTNDIDNVLDFHFRYLRRKVNEAHKK